MRLAFVTELFHPSIGGQEVRFEELGQELVRRGHSVDLFTIRFDPSTPEREERGGVVVHRLASSPRYKSSRFRRNPLDILRFTWALWKRRGTLGDYDAVVFNIWPILPQFALGPVLKGRAVVDICETRGGFFWWAVYRGIARIPGVRLLGVNPEIVRHMGRVHGVPASRCEVVVSGVDLAAAGEPPVEKNPRQILFFGRMTGHKNPRMLVEAFRDSGIAEQGCRLEVAGGGPELEPLRRDLPVAGVTYHGRVSDEEKWRLLRESSLLAMPSRREGFPRVVAEGACVGTPTLSLDFPDNGTCSVVRDFGVGRICPPSGDALVEALRAFAADPDSYRDLAHHCVEGARPLFSWDSVVESLVHFLSRKD